ITRLVHRCATAPLRQPGGGMGATTQGTPRHRASAALWMPPSWPRAVLGQAWGRAGQEAGQGDSQVGSVLASVGESAPMQHPIGIIAAGAHHRVAPRQGLACARGSHRAWAGEAARLPLCARSPARSQPGACSPARSQAQPGARSPATSQPGARSPATSQPGARSPATSQAQPGACSPATSQPGTRSPARSQAQPGACSPATSQPGARSPATSQAQPGARSTVRSQPGARSPARSQPRARSPARSQAQPGAHSAVRSQRGARGAARAQPAAHLPLNEERAPGSRAGTEFIQTQPVKDFHSLKCFRGKITMKHPISCGHPGAHFLPALSRAWTQVCGNISTIPAWRFLLCSASLPAGMAAAEHQSCVTSGARQESPLGGAISSSALYTSVWQDSIFIRKYR
uniref:Uncharacterized protein n=1 Tax=Chelonoidis abingdonii TaxID=106734 RepID=A0A8C0HBS3_CHEAB